MLLTVDSTCVPSTSFVNNMIHLQRQNFSVRNFGKVSQFHIFGDTQISLQHRVGQVKKASIANTSSISSEVSIEHRLVIDTDIAIMALKQCSVGNNVVMIT